MSKKKKRHPFTQGETEPSSAAAEAEHELGQDDDLALTDDEATGSPPIEPSEPTADPPAEAEPPVEVDPPASDPEPIVESPSNVGPLSAIGPSELLDRLKASKTGKAKIAAGRAFIEANPDERSERMVEVLGSNPRDRGGAGKLRAVGYWPAGTVRKAAAILKASPASS